MAAVVAEHVETLGLATLLVNAGSSMALHCGAAGILHLRLNVSKRGSAAALAHASQARFEGALERSTSFDGVLQVLVPRLEI